MVSMVKSLHEPSIPVVLRSFAVGVLFRLQVSFVSGEAMWKGSLHGFLSEGSRCPNLWPSNGENDGESSVAIENGNFIVDLLVGGLEHFLCSHILGIIIPID